MISPHFFGERDYPWIRRFYDDFLRFKGKRRRELLEFFAGGLSFEHPEKKVKLLLHLLLKKTEADTPALTVRRARELRSALFLAASANSCKPEATTVLTQVATQFELEPESVLEQAFRDLPQERILMRMPEGGTPAQLALQANLALIQALVCRSSLVEIQLIGDVRKIVRQAKLRRLICEIQDLPHTGVKAGCLLRFSGPLSIFGHTTVYGRALAELVPLLSWCNHFTLSAICRIRGRDGLLTIQSGDPILPASEPRGYDSRLEQRFAKEFCAAALDWDLIREPAPFPLAGGTNSLIFPDFLIQHRRAPSVQYYLEIVGFWTPEYLTHKLETLRSALIPNLILCIDETLACGEALDFGEIQKLGKVVLFKKRISIDGVLQVLTFADQWK